MSIFARSRELVVHWRDRDFNGRSDAAIDSAEVNALAAKLELESPALLSPRAPTDPGPPPGRRLLVCWKVLDDSICSAFADEDVGTDTEAEAEAASSRIFAEALEEARLKSICLRLIGFCELCSGIICEDRLLPVGGMRTLIPLQIAGVSGNSSNRSGSCTCWAFKASSSCLVNSLGSIFFSS